MNFQLQNYTLLYLLGLQNKTQLRYNNNLCLIFEKQMLKQIGFKRYIFHHVMSFSVFSLIAPLM